MQADPQGATLLSSAQLVLKSLAFFPFNNSRLLVLPGCDSPNLISRFMKLMLAQLSGDWERRWGHPLALVESFVDPRFYQGTAYKVSGWLHLGRTAGWKRGADGDTPERVLLRWQTQLLGPTQDRLVIVDGKKVRHGGVEIVNAVDGAGRFLGSVVTPAKTNEIPAADVCGQTGAQPRPVGDSGPAMSRSDPSASGLSGGPAGGPLGNPRSPQG